MKIRLILSVAALGVAFAATPASAANDPTKLGCTRMENGKCAAWNQLDANEARHVRLHDVFGPNYPYYMKLSDLPQQMVKEYDLDLRSLYVGSSNGYLFVIDPTGYEVVRIIPPAVHLR